ncbi:MAG TPA: hypothetical protein VKR06_06720 [Ktedonosporobacter sp.]|nr:hypothetical protein [Ktedonosporobacter sp.]
MSNANKALLIGFIIGALVLSIAGFLFAPHLLAAAGVKVVVGQIAYPAGIFS